MPGAADWQDLPNSVTDAWQQSQDAQNWAEDQRKQNASDWANIQKAIPSPSAPPDQTAGGGGAVPSPVPDSTAPPSPSSPPSAGLGQWPAPSAPLPSNFNAGTPAPNAPVTAPLTAPSDQTDDVETYIRQAAQQRGIDPDIAVRVYHSEGKPAYVGDNNSSFGPFQLHYGGVASGGNRVAGLGDTFTEQTGLDARDPSTWKQQVDFALDQVRKSGWGPWHGAAAQGITGMQGIGAAPEQITAGQAGESGIAGAAQRTSQFAMGLSSADAMAFCGPAAAIAFAQTYGRNPTIDEAKALAKEVGWNPNQGMAGVVSEQALLTKMGVQTKLEQGVDWNHVASDANNGNPVIIDTPGHYFYITGARDGPNGPEFNVGTSGTDLKAGSQWMTAADMAKTMGAPRAALYADHPLAQGPSVAESTQPPDTSASSGSFAQSVGDKVNGIGSALQSFAFNGPIGATRDAVQGATNYVLSGQAKSDLADNLAQNPIPGAPGLNVVASAALNMPTVLDNVQTISDLIQKYPPTDPRSPMPNLDAMTPDDRQKWMQASVVIGGMVGGEGQTPGRPLFGRGGVPGADVGRNPVPAPTQPGDLEESLAQSQLQVVMKQARDAGMSDQDITNVFKSIGASDEQIQNALHPPEPQMVPLSQKPTPREPVIPPVEAPTNVATGAAPEEPPPVQYDVNGNVAATNGVPVANPMQNVTPTGELAPGPQNIPGPAGGAEPPTMPRSQRPDLMISPGAAQPEGGATTPNIDPNASPPGGPSLGQALSAVPAEMKKSIFSLSNVHAGNIVRGLLTSPAGPGGAAQFAQRYVTALVRGPSNPAEEADMIDTATNAIRDGVNFFGGQNPETGGAPAGFNPILVAGARAAGGAVFGAAGGAEYAHATGDDENMLRDAVLGGTVGALGGPTVAMRMHDALWQDAVPFAKLMTYKAATDAGVDGRQAAMFANNLNGGQNLAAIAGSKPVQELARWALQSPDWLVSQLKLTGAGVAGTAKTVARQPLTGNEQLSRDWLLKSALTYGVATEALQYALTGHFTDQNSPGSQFQVEVPSGQAAPNGKPENVTFSVFPGNLGQVLDAADRSVTQGQQGAMTTIWDKANRIPATAAEEAYNFRYPGGPPIASKGASPQEAAQQRATFAGSQFAPLGIFSPAEEIAAGASPAATAFLTALGFPMSHNTRKQGAGSKPTPQPIPAGPNRYGAGGQSSGVNRYTQHP